MKYNIRMPIAILAVVGSVAALSAMVQDQKPSTSLQELEARVESLEVLVKGLDFQARLQQEHLQKLNRTILDVVPLIYKQISDLEIADRQHTIGMLTLMADQNSRAAGAPESVRDAIEALVTEMRSQLELNRQTQLDIAAKEREHARQLQSERAFDEFYDDTFKKSNRPPR